MDQDKIDEGLPGANALEGYSSYFGFLRRGVQPPSNLYIERDDIIRVEILSPGGAQTVRVSMRLMQPDGQVTPQQFEYTVTTATVNPQVQIIDGLEGFLLSMSINSTASLRGQVFVRTLMQRGAGSSDLTRGEILCQGYASLYESLSYPYGTIDSSLRGRGALRAFIGSAPAAGAEISETVPVGRNWILRSFVTTLVTSATVASREPSVTVDDGGANILARSVDSSGIAASRTVILNWAPGLVQERGSVVHDMAFPMEMRMLPTWRIRTNTLAIQAGDQYAAPAILVEEFIAP